jgi:hypothetical protein
MFGKTFWEDGEEMTYEEKLELLKDRTSKKACTFGDEGDREGVIFEVRDTDFEWLMFALVGKDRVIESFSRIIDDMEKDYEQMEADRDYWKTKYLLLQHQ